MLRQHADTLARMQQRFGVEPATVVAVWGVESNFGQSLGKYPLVQALGTLSCIGRRQAFFRGELYSAMRILQAGHIAHAVQRAGDVGHLHGHFCHGVATITWFASRLTGLPFSFTAHAKDIYQAELNPGDLLERKMHGARFVATCTCANAHVLRAPPAPGRRARDLPRPGH